MTILSTTNTSDSEQCCSRCFCGGLVITQILVLSPLTFLFYYILPGCSHLNSCTSYGLCPRDPCKTQNSLLGSRTRNATAFWNVLQIPQSHSVPKPDSFPPSSPLIFCFLFWWMASPSNPKPQSQPWFLDLPHCFPSAPTPNHPVLSIRPSKDLFISILSLVQCRPLFFLSLSLCLFLFPSPSPS